MTGLDVSERDLTRQVADLAQLFGWRRYHTWLSKHSPAGYPDETLLRRERLVGLELKSEKGASPRRRRNGSRTGGGSALR